MIFYNVAYFNRNKIESDFQKFVLKSKGTLKNYDALRNIDCPDPPQTLSPFFILFQEKPCVLSKFINTYSNCFEDTVNTYINSLTNYNFFKSFVVSYFLSPFEKELSINKVLQNDGESIAKAIELLSQKMPVSFFSNMLFHFEDFVEELVSFLQILKPKILLLHSKQRMNTLRIIQSFLSDDSQVLLKKCCRFPDTIDLNNQTYSVCYLNPYIVARQSDKNLKRYAIMLGCESRSVLSRHIEYNDYNNLDLSSVLEILGHRLKLEILFLLHRQPMTISQLSKNLHISRTSIYRYITDLEINFVILRASKSGAEIYYSTNTVYFRHAQGLVSSFFKEFTYEQNDRI